MSEDLYDKNRISNMRILPLPHRITSAAKGKTVQWSGTDNERIFSSVKKWTLENNVNWRYIKEPIHYDLDKLGHRHKEDITENYDFTNKVVFLGCSHVHGIGVPEKYTINNHFTNITGIETVNMGLGGIGNDRIFYTAMWLMGLEKPPLDIVVLWTYTMRFSSFKRNYVDDTRTRVHKSIEQHDQSNLTFQDQIELYQFTGSQDVNHTNYKTFYKPEYIAYPEDQLCSNLIYRNLFESTYKKIYNKKPKSYSFWDKALDIHYDNRFTDRNWQKIQPFRDGKIHNEEYILNNFRGRDVESLSFRTITDGKGDVIKTISANGGHYGIMSLKIVAEIITEDHVSDF